MNKRLSDVFDRGSYARAGTITENPEGGRVEVFLANDHGDRRCYTVVGVDRAERAVELALERAGRDTGDDSYAMDEWEATP